jgi:hypothetical protein
MVGERERERKGEREREQEGLMNGSRRIEASIAKLERKEVRTDVDCSKCRRGAEVDVSS